ncbi:aquaporin-7-like [Ischnura elegans]|uniref:aquaporin-7-like n=1 Tax=Ischnura elegans TaxID=197161 RepID=UPI001ED8B8C6|nr:aquaporin-7-like [Ischnura elegans]
MDKISDKCRLQSLPAREFFAEFLGTFVLVLVGDASVAQSVLSHTVAGAFLSVNVAWGVAVMMGVLICGGVSGGHINPAVTLAMALIGKCPWRKVPYYLAAQYLGAFLGAACTYVVYLDALDAFDGGNRTVEGLHATAGIFATYPAGHLSLLIGFVDQVIGTFLLLLAVCAITDKRNMQVPSGLVPLLVGFVVIAIGAAFGFNCGYAINPARDLSPRIFTAIAGWGLETFTYKAWWWVPIVGPHVGAVLGASLYAFLVEFHWPPEGL